MKKEYVIAGVGFTTTCQTAKMRDYYNKERNKLFKTMQKTGKYPDLTKLNYAVSKALASGLNLKFESHI